LDQRHTTTAIPPKCTGAPERTESITARLRRLGVGEYLEVPRKQESSFYRSAKNCGITISARRMGAVDTTRIYRVS
jgi:hypothetical protein